MPALKEEIEEAINEGIKFTFLVTPLEAMPAMLAQILGPGVRGIVVAGMLAATMSVTVFYVATQREMGHGWWPRIKI